MDRGMDAIHEDQDLKGPSASTLEIGKMKIASILASLGLVAPAAIAAPTPSATRNTGRILLASCETAIRSGAWNVDGACDPDGALRRLDIALLTSDEQEIADCAAYLASVSLDAIAGGDWMVDGDSLAAIIDASERTAANDTHHQEAVAA